MEHAGQCARRGRGRGLLSSAPYSGLPPDVAEARAQLGPAYRRLGHAIAGRIVDADELHQLAVELESAADRLETLPVRDRRDEQPPTGLQPAPDSGEAMYTFDERPVSGRAAPLGFDLDVTREGDEAVGRLTLGPAHEGAPHRSHGGMISALLDDMFGFILTIEQQPGFTGELTVRYEAGTPIGQPLECRVRMVEREGRKLHMTGELTLEGDPSTVFARGKAVFIVIDADRFRQLSTPKI